MGLKGQLRTPQEQVRTRRNADNLAGSVDFINPAGGLTLTEAGTLEVVTSPTGGVQLTVNGIALLLNDDPGLAVDAGGLAVQPGDASIEVDAAGVKVNTDPNGGLGVSAEGLQIVGGIPIETEVPAGTVDGVNDEFTLASIPQDGEVLLFHNGLLMFDDAAGDYERAGQDVTFNAGAIPETGDRLLAVYLKGIGAAGEVPGGLVDGANDEFTLANEPEASSLMLFHNGVLMAQGATADYTLAGSTITFDPTGIPESGDRLYAAYERAEA